MIYSNNLHQQTEQYSFLWQDADTWAVEQSHGHTVQVKVHFAGNAGPSLHELTLLRQWLPDLRYLPPGEVHKRFQNSAVYDLGTFGGLEGHRLCEAGKTLGLNAVSQVQHYSHVQFFCPSNGAIVRIDDEELNDFIQQRMIEAGCVTICIEED